MAIAVSSAADLNNVRNDLSGDYIQTADIDLSEWGTWTPIGDWENYFYGSYDGGGYKITGMTAHGHQGVGLFSHVGIPTDMEEGQSRHIEIKNVKLENVRVTGSFYVGGLIGYVARIGAHENKTIHIFRCSVDNPIDEEEFAVSAEHDSVGLLVGWIDCWQVENGLIEQCFTRGRVSGGQDVGGLVGVCYVAQFRDCFFRGEVHMPGAGNWHVYGGIAAMADTSTFENCYTQALFSADELWGWPAVGPITGGTGNIGDITSCYFTYETDLEGTYILVENGTERTPEDMRFPENFNTTYLDWDFENVWRHDPAWQINAGYPHFEDVGFNIWVYKSGVWMLVPSIWSYKSGAWQALSTVDAMKSGFWNPI